IEEEQLGAVDQRAGDREPLFLPAGQRADAGAALFLELHEREHLVHRVGAPVEAAEQRDRLRDRELVAELGVLELDAETLARRAAMTASEPATSAMVPMLAVEARWRRCVRSRAMLPQRLSMSWDRAARFESSSATMPLTRLATCRNAFTCSMRAAWAGLSFLPAMSVPGGERLDQHPPVEQRQRRNAEETRQRRRDVHRVRAPREVPGFDAASPQDQRHVAVE